MIPCILHPRAETKRLPGSTDAAKAFESGSAPDHVASTCNSWEKLTASSRRLRSLITSAAASRRV